MQQQISAKFVPSSLRKENRTVDLVFATETPVARSEKDGTNYFEKLVITHESIDFSRLNGGAPVLNSHGASKIQDQIGVVEKAWLEADKACARVRFSARQEAQNIFEDVADGILQNVSVGYRVLETKDERVSNGNLIRHITRWEPLEISLVSIPADKNSRIRSEEPWFHTQLERERERARKIRDLCIIHQLTREEENRFLDGGYSFEQAKEEVLSTLKKRSMMPSPHIEVQSCGREKRRRSIVAALHHTYSGATGAPPEEARAFSGKRFLDLAKDELQRDGLQTQTMSTQQVVSRALASTDFPIILGELASVNVKDAFQNVQEQATYHPLVRYESTADFKPIKSIELDALGGLELVPEGSKLSYGTLSESEEQFRIFSYGKGFAITRELLINDSLGLVLKAIERFGEQSARLLSDLIYDLLNRNIRNHLGSPLFTEENSREALAEEPLSLELLAEAEFQMSNQRDKNGQYLNVLPNILVVPTRHKALAQRLLYGAYTPNVAEKARLDPFLQIVAEPRLNVHPDRFYLASSQGTIFKVVHLDGQKTPTVSSQFIFDPRESLQIRVDYDVGVAAGDPWSLHRTTVKSAKKKGG